MEGMTVVVVADVVHGFCYITCYLRLVGAAWAVRQQGLLDVGQIGLDGQVGQVGQLQGQRFLHGQGCCCGCLFYF